ncbi:MAG: carboxypeptidase-like regulatory domain-containing protein [Promethearchaeota archaeon]
MSKSYYKCKFNKKVIVAVFIIVIFIIPISASSNHFINYHKDDNIALDLRSADSSPYLFQGNEVSLNITDKGNLYESNQEISLTNQEEINLTYYLDDVHDWKISKIQNTITNVRDTREWVEDSDFQSIGLNIYRVNETHENDRVAGEYRNNRDKGNSLDPISHTGAIAMRAHFMNYSMEDYYDYVFIDDKDGNTGFQASYTKLTPFFSPWIPGDTLDVYLITDGVVNDYGYYIDFYEFVNGTIDTNPWGYDDIAYSQYIHGSTLLGNNSAMYVGMYADLLGDAVEGYFPTYYDDDYVEIYQNLTIPRGSVVDGYISFDYYADYAMAANDFAIYCSINGQEIYSKGFYPIVQAGKYTWQNTGKVNLLFWTNTSNVFNDVIDTQNINISIGIRCLVGWTYSYTPDEFQQVIGFDNLTLGLTTIANSTQDGINLNVNNHDLIDGSVWGSSFLNLTDGWENNPVTLTINTTSPDLAFDLNTILYGYHETTSKINQLNVQGISYQVLENSSIFWEFYHNFYMPAEYSDFEFFIKKPYNWKIISVLDPTLQSRTFEGGDIVDNYLKINTSNAIYPGWWKFRASSPNYLNMTNTKISRNGQWGFNEFYSGDSIKIKTQVNYTNEIPLNLDQTTINLTIYYPNGTMWYQESKIPLSNGSVIFSEILLTSLNSVGGIYNYTLFWSNGTALGGLKSNFAVIHASYLTILKPDDAKLDNQTGGTVGDIIPLRIYLRDAENDLYISDALVSYNWTTGTEFLVEASLGIYETVLDTADLGGFGLYNIIISTSRVGFINSNLTLRINLGEDSNLQRLESDSKIVIHRNSTIRFFYYSEFDEEGIPGAQVLVNISNPAYYTVQDDSDGYYSIEFSTEFIDDLGIYRLVFDFSAIGFEPQTHIFQFEIINPPETREEPNYLLLGILFASIGIGAIFAALSLRSYVILPRKRRKESELLAETQRFKDIRNIQAIVVIHKLSGIPIFSRSYSILEKHNKELFSGFIQAITTIGEEFAERESTKPKMKESAKGYGSERIMELDFKYFYCLIADLEEVRTVLVLSEKSSERLKSQLRHLLLALNLNLSEQLQSWDGSLEQFEIILPSILNEYFELYYKESFQLNIRDTEFLKMTKDKSLNKMEIRVLNVINSVAKSKENIIHLDTIINLVHEENKDIIIKAIESLIAQKIIIPYNL